VTYEEQWLNMAVGALRAAGIAAAALGYHVWRLLTKQDAAALADIEDSEEVVHKTKRLLLLPWDSTVLTSVLWLAANITVLCRASEVILWGLRLSFPLSVVIAL